MPLVLPPLLPLLVPPPEGKEIPVVKTIATEHNGIETLAKAVEQYFAELNSIPEKRIQLLADKCWQLIQAQRMKNIDRAELIKKLAAALNEPGFNIYAFTQRFLQLLH